MPPVPTPQPCVCGGAPIAPIAGDWHAIAAAVNEHNRTDQDHLTWAARLYLDRGPLARPAAASVDTDPRLLAWSADIMRELVG